MDRFSFEDGAHDRQLLLGAKRYAVLELWYRLLLAAGPGQRPRMAAYVIGNGPQGGRPQPEGASVEYPLRLAYIDGEPDGPRSYATTIWAVRGRVL